MMYGAIKTRWDITVTSDASGSWGCGAYTSTREWFQLRWPPSWESIHITVKELLPMVVAAAAWGKQCEGRSVKCRCDNAATVAIINSERSKIERAMHLMQSMFLFLACHKAVLFGEHIPGVENGAADALSRDKCHDFFLQVAQAERHPPSCPKQSDWPWCCSSYLTAR